MISGGGRSTIVVSYGSACRDVACSSCCGCGCSCGGGLLLSAGIQIWPRRPSQITSHKGVGQGWHGDQPCCPLLYEGHKRRYVDEWMHRANRANLSQSNLVSKEGIGLRIRLRFFLRRRKIGEGDSKLFKDVPCYFGLRLPR